MDTTNIEKFDPTQAELAKMVTTSKSITELSDPLEIREMRLSLKNARVTITKKGKELREEAIAYQKAIIAKEKELIGIIEPEEERLAGIEELAKALKEKADRVNLLPMRRARLAELGITEECSDDFLCDFDTTEFTEWTNAKVAAINEEKRLELEKKEAAIKEAEAVIAREKEMKEREEKAREEEKERAAQALIQAEEDAKRRVKEAEDRAKAEADAKEKARLMAIEEEKIKAAAEAKRIAEETAKREADERYRKWLADNGALPEVTGWMAIRDPYGADQMVLYKEVSRFVL
jgi:hypothetical protein